MPKTVWVGAFRLLAVSFVWLALAGPAAAQIFETDNVVLLANRDLYGGYNDVWGFVGTNGREYVIQGTTTGTAWWDIDDPVNPVLVKFIGGPSSIWRDMFVIGDHAYVGTEGGGGIQIVDISDPTNPTLVNTYTATVGASHNIFGDPSRDLLFVVGGYQGTNNGGMQVLDATDPVNLVEIGQWDNRYIHDMSIEGTIAHVNLISNDRFRLVDLSDPANPVNTGSAYADPTGACHASWPLGNGTHVAMVEETGGGHLKILDITTPTAITLSAAENPAPAASAHNVHVEGNLCFVSWYARGTRIIDVTDPTNISEVGYLDTYPASDGGGVGPGNWGVFPHLPSGVIASNDGTHGLFLFRFDEDAGLLNGTVSPSAGSFLAGVSAEYVDLNQTQELGGGGFYQFSSAAGTGLELRFSAYGFESSTVFVDLAASGVTTTNVTLTQVPSGGISGTITDAGSGSPLALAEIELVGTPLRVETDGSGAYAFPQVPSGSYAVRVLRYGYVASSVPATVATGQVETIDFELESAPVYEDFATPTGWTVDSDPATSTGFWVFDEPFGTYSGGVPFQPELDHTLNPEDQCAVTGNLNSGGLGDDDVDGGATRLLSPVLDLSTMTEPHVFYYRWYAVSTEDDEWRVEVTGDGGAQWTELEATAQHAPVWTAVDANLTGLLPSYGAVQFRFTAEDPPPGQLVEAAIDDFTVYDAAGDATDIPHLPGPDARLRLELAQNSPNPFPSDTSIRFSVPAKGHVELSVFDVRGARVAVLVDDVLEPGGHEVGWNGRTYTGGQASAGVYFYKLSTGREIRTRKMLRLN